MTIRCQRGGNLMKVFVIVPAYNEAVRIARVVESMPPDVDEIIVVDDHSRDETARIARRLGATVVQHAENRGVGAAIVTGYKTALERPGSERDAFVVMAGDAQMDPRDLPQVVAPVHRGDAGYVKGNRFAHREIWGSMPWPRRLGGAAFSLATSWAIGQPIQDSQCGFTAISRAACRALALDSLWPGYGYPNDMLGMLARARIPIAEVIVRPIYAGEASGLRPRHLGVIGWLVARAAARRARSRAESFR